MNLIQGSFINDVVWIWGGSQHFFVGVVYVIINLQQFLIFSWIRSENES